MAQKISESEFYQDAFNEFSIYEKEKKPLRVISVTSGKGGVGKSTLVLNLALSLSKRGNRVLVLDADIGLSNIDIMMGAKPEKNLWHVLSGKAKLSEIIIHGPNNLMIIPGGNGFSEFSNLSNEQKIHILSEFDELSTEIDFLLIDTAPGIHSNVTFFNTCASEIIIVSNSEPTSITDAYALIKVLSLEKKMSEFSLIVNMVATEKEAHAVFNRITKVMEKFLNVSLKYLGYLPFDKLVSTSIKEQNPLMNREVYSPYTIKVMKITDQLEKNLPEKPLHGNLQIFMNRIIEGNI